MARARKNRKSKARQRMAESSINRRIKALEKIAGNQAGVGATVLRGLWGATLFGVDLIQIWQGLSPEMQAVVKATLNNVVVRFMASIDGMPADEQVLQAAELIKVLRIMEKVLGESSVPVLGNYFTETVFKESLEDAILDARLAPEEIRLGKFRALREIWDLQAEMAVRGEVRNVGLPIEGLA